MFLSYFTLFVALCLSVTAAWYSIVGLTAIFATAVIPIIIMGSILEVAKVTVTVWLHQYWQHCRWLMKLYLVPAVIMLMVITSMGIFGFLSKAHLDQAVPTGDVAARVQIIDEKIKTQRDNIDAAKRALVQMDAQVDQMLSRTDSEKGAERAVTIRRNQAKERGNLQNEIAAAQKTIVALQAERAPIASELRKVEAEVGPIKYIAALIYGDNPDANVLEKAVRWVIIILVVVFDPLAIMMVLASTESLKWEKQRRETVVVVKEAEPEPKAEPDTEEHTVVAGPPDNPWPYPEPEEVIPWPRDEEPVEPQEVVFNLPPEIVSPAPVEIVASDEDPESDEDKLLKKAWKAENPDKTLKDHRGMHQAGHIDVLPWQEPEFRQRVLGAAADNEPHKLGTVRGFGIQFPAQANKGDLFVRVDIMPNRLYKYNGNDWIVVEKTLNESYAYNDAYIDHLIAKIDSGEYDPDLLNDVEREQIAVRLKG
jgi:hypothetical protein